MPGTPPHEMVQRDDGFTVVLTRDGDVVRVILRGEFDLAGEERWRQTLAELGDDWSEILVDLSALELLDSTGLRLIVGLHQQCEAAERGFSVRLGHGAARRLFELSGLRHTFPEAPEEDD